jgi:hypothetical protein
VGVLTPTPVSISIVKDGALARFRVIGQTEVRSTSQVSEKVFCGLVRPFADVAVKWLNTETMMR